MCACDDSVSRAEKFRRSIDGLKRGALIGCHPRNFCAQNDVFVGVRVGFVLRLTLDKQIGMCPPQKKISMPKTGEIYRSMAATIPLNLYLLRAPGTVKHRGITLGGVPSHDMQGKCPTDQGALR